MHSHTSASFFLAAALSVGIASAVLLEPNTSPCLALMAGSILLFWILKNRASRLVFWSLAGISSVTLGMWCMARTLPENRPLHYANRQIQRSGPLQVRVTEALRHNTYSYRFLAEVTALGGKPSEGTLLLEIRRDSAIQPPEIGQEILSTVLPTPVQGPRNPGQFDYRAYLKGLGVYGRLVLEKPVLLPVSPENKGFMITVADIRLRLLKTLESAGLPADELGIAKALLLGDRTHVDPGLYASYRKAGALHLLAVSGLHVGILAAFLFSLLRPLRKFRYGRLLRFLLATLLLWGYALLCGFSPSVVRAVILFSGVSYAFYLQRPGETLHFLALAWIFMLVLVDPHWLLQVGFQLSFAAVAAIVVFSPALFRYWPWKGKAGASLGQLVCVSLAAQVGTLPLSLYYFHQFPGVFLLSNLVLLPGIGVLLITGFACLLLQALGFLPALLAFGYSQLLLLMNGFIHWAGTLDGFHLDGLPWDATQLLFSILGLWSLGVYLRGGGNRWSKVAAVLFLGLQVCSMAIQANHLGERSWIVPHRVKASGVWVRQGSRLQVFSGDSLSMHPLVRDAQTEWHLDSIAYRPISARYSLGVHSLRVLEPPALYSPREPAPDYLLLSGSPRIHLERLLEELRPGQVIADGSNYKSLVTRWKMSCESLGVPFHDTSSDGAFVRDLLPESR